MIAPRALILAGSILLFLAYSAQAETVFTRHVTFGQDLFQHFTELTELEVKFTVDEPTCMFVSGSLSVAHQHLASTAVAVGMVIRLGGYDLPGSPVGVDLLGSIGSVHNSDYWPIPLHAFRYLQQGDYVLEVWANANSNAAPINGLAEIRADYNMMVVMLKGVSEGCRPE